jgi:hypothetical protein
LCDAVGGAFYYLVLRMQNPCRRQAIIITLGANATTCRRQAIYVYWYPFLCPPYAKRTPIPRQRLIRRRRISLKRDNHPPLVKQKQKGKICFVIHIAGEKKIIILHILRDCEAKIYKRSSNHYSHTHTHTHTHVRARARTHTHTRVYIHTMTGVLDSPTLGRRRTMLYFTVVSVLGSLLLSFTWYMGPGALFAGNVLMRFSVLVPYTIMYELLKSQYTVTLKHKCTGALNFSDFCFLPRYIYVAEILPTSHRNTGIALGQGASKSVGCVLPLLLLPLVEYRAPLSGLSLSQAVLRSGGILANTKSARQKQQSVGAVRVRKDSTAASRSLYIDIRSLSSRSLVQEQVPLGRGGGETTLHSMGDSEKALGAGQRVVAQVSVPYLILAICSIVAAALLATSPDPTDSLCDTVLETKLALESPRRSHSQTVETQPLVSATTPRSSGSSRTPVWV